MKVADFSTKGPNNLGYTELNESTVVSINLSGTGQDVTQRIAVNETVKLVDLPVIAAGQASPPPVYPQEEINKINNSHETNAVKLSKINEIIANYNEELEAYEETNQCGVLTDEVRLLLAVREYLIQNFGFGRTQDENKPYIEASDMQVTVIKTPDNFTVASVSGTSVWG